MLKIYITAVDSKPNGSAVTLFEDLLRGYDDKDDILNAESLNDIVFNKLEEVEASNDAFANPL